MDAQRVHGNTYDYSKVIYINSVTDVIIICEEHGEFSQEANSHLQGHGCKKCYNKRRGLRLSFEDFLQRATNKHGNRYIYDNVYYINTTTLVEIICRIHGSFKQTPNNHIYCGSGCKICAILERSDSKTLTTKEFVEMAISIHLYTYDKVKYIHYHENVIITCKKHGDFCQSPFNHFRGYGCRKCGDEKRGNDRRLTTQEFKIKSIEIHGDLYNYDKVIYETSTVKVEIICKIHDSFYQNSSSHLAGHGCPFCRNKTEGKLLKWLRKNNFVIEYQKKFEWCKSNINSYLPFDFYFPELNIIVELDGNQHFFQVSNWKSPEETQETDNAKMKMKMANGNNISVIRIYQPNVWNDKNNWQQHLLDTIKKYNTPINICIGDIYEQCYDIKYINKIERINNLIPYSQNLNDMILFFQELTIDSRYVCRIDGSSNIQLEII